MFEHDLIARVYEGQHAERTGVPYINHIDEGLAVLDLIGASPLAHRAYCVHPLVQGDADLVKHREVLRQVDGEVVALAMEYRWVANNCLSHHGVQTAAEIQLSVLPEVNAMLVADKVQNRKDFEAHHKGSHPRSDALDLYFRLWLERLGVSEADYARYTTALAALGHAIADLGEGAE